MELRHLRYFVAVAESLHFGQAAAKLHIAQPSLSHQIQQLEADLQTGLLRRTKRHVELTEAGRLFLQEARDILARADWAVLVARRVGRGDVQRLRIGVGYWMDQSEVARVVGKFTARYPAVEVEVKTLSVPLQLGSLRDGRLDAGFVRPPISDPALSSDVLIREPLVLALPTKHRLSDRGRIPLTAVASDLFVMPSRDTVPLVHDATLKACREAGFVPNAPHEADHLHVILGMVAAGAGIALVPAAAALTIRRHAVVYRPLHPPPDHLITAIAWRRDDTAPTLAEFLQEARRTSGRRRAARA
jgi:DNA-binding transcriptional LysR family regulator